VLKIAIFLNEEEIKMKIKKLNKKYLQKRTFWDADFNNLDEIRDQAFIVARLVQRGSDLELLHLQSVFSYSEIYVIIKNYMGVPTMILDYYKTMANASS